MVWIDLILFLLLFALFIYVFASVTITNLHKVYLVFHFSMMLWPFCQFALKTTENPMFQLFYVKLAFIDSSMLATGWLLFTIFLTGRSKFLRIKSSLLLFIPSVVLSLGVITNPHDWFVLPVDGGYIQRTYGPIFWCIVIVMIIYIVISFYIIYLTLVSGSSQRIKKQVQQVFKGILVMTTFVIMDIFLNVILDSYLPVIPGLTSLGILLSAVFFVISIHRDKVLDIVTIAHQDIIDTIALGILVLDEGETVVEINQSLSPYLNLRIGDAFDMSVIFTKEHSDNRTDNFLETYKNSPLENIEIEWLQTNIQRYIKVDAAPIMVRGVMVGRIITFQDMTELRSLFDETTLQNDILQERNQMLIGIQNELFQTNRKLKQMAITDSLTGCYNRHYLTQQLEHEVMKNRKSQTPFAIFLLDIDFFKLVNDNYGHLAGDEVICSTVETIKQTLREDDILARYGGEEFIVYLPNTTSSEALPLAERIKARVEVNKVIVENADHPVSVTVSMGLLSINKDFRTEHTDSPKTYLNDLFESVDKALYQAKKEGRNQIVSILR
ncbi:diguanylate cyclase [Paenibacillus wynnii]|uniref:histidine kinase N-terminal 7TM domain-containing diguanylate cyclase n=1 Tax=Paenibacillus wynnii TaxID=268407 RepID=UPI001F0A5212|nr:diguanylate cyclase [Paenibacillus wynnii]